jgi:hypothetical protein
MTKNNTEQQVQVPQLVFDEMVECIQDARNLLKSFLARNLSKDLFEDKENRLIMADALAMLERADDLSNDEDVKFLSDEAK